MAQNTRENGTVHEPAERSPELPPIDKFRVKLESNEDREEAYRLLGVGGGEEDVDLILDRISDAPVSDDEFKLAIRALSSIAGSTAYLALAMIAEAGGSQEICDLAKADLQLLKAMSVEPILVETFSFLGGNYDLQRLFESERRLTELANAKGCCHR